MKRLLFKLSLVAGIAVALSSCYPGGAEYVSDTDLVLTNYDAEYPFSNVTTYYLSDTVRHITDEGAKPNNTYDSYIIGEIARNLDALGWTRLDNTEIDSLHQPNVNIVASVAEVTTTNIYYYPYYPGWGWYWKGSQQTFQYYGWYYPWYGYGGATVTSYTTGTVFMLMFDPSMVDKVNEKIHLNWAGVINGVEGSSGSNTKSRITKGIDQAFRQSAYLKGQ